MKSIHTRRTIRQYTTQSVDDTLLRRLLEEASRTQTMGNLQLYSVVITRDAENKKRLSPLHFGQPMVEQAPVVLTFCADFHRTTRWCETRNALPGYDNLLSLFNTMSDCLLYCQTFCNLAEEEGLGLCYLGTTLYNAGPIIDVLQLPALTLPVATITLGWPAEEPPLTDRLPLSAIVHEEHYNAYTTADINTYYLPKEQLPENKTFVEINNKETLAQVIAECRYKKEDNENISQTLLKTLERQGFIHR